MKLLGDSVYTPSLISASLQSLAIQKKERGERGEKGGRGREMGVTTVRNVIFIFLFMRCE